MNIPDIRWQQRFANFKKALAQLKNAVELSKQRPLSLLEKQGVIQAFEFTHELAWNVLKETTWKIRATNQLKAQKTRPAKLLRLR